MATRPESPSKAPKSAYPLTTISYQLVTSTGTIAGTYDGPNALQMAVDRRAQVNPAWRIIQCTCSHTDVTGYV